MKPILYALFMLFITVPAFAQEATQAPEHWLKPVEAEYDCMVNDTVFEKTQIPVEVGDQTYYGCCMGCVSTLQNDTAIRSAVDPVSGNHVDKATAIIGAAPDKTVYYFESMENLESYHDQTKE